MDLPTGKTRALAAALILTLLLLLQESLLRLAFPIPELEGFNRINYMPVAEAGKEVRGIRSLRVSYVSEPDHAAFLLTLNEYGFRDGRWKTRKTPGYQRVMFVGDSFVEGVMVGDDFTIPRLFQSRAGEEGLRVEAMNFGVTGSNWEMYLNLVADAVPWFQPDWVILVVYARNFTFDATKLAARPIRRSSPFRPRLLDLLDRYRGGDMVPLRYGRRTVSFDQPVPHPSNPLSDPGVEAALREFVAPEILQAMKKGGFNPYRAGSTRWYEEMLRKPFDYREQLAVVRDVLARHNARLLVAYVPERRQISNHYQQYEKDYSPDDFDMTQPQYRQGAERLAEECSRMGIPFVSAIPAMEQLERQGTHLYWNYDDHLDVAGNEAVARILLEAWSPLARERSGLRAAPPGNR